MKRMMAGVAVLTTAGLILSGCASPEQIAAQNELIQKRNSDVINTMQEVKRAKDNAVVACSNKASCDKAFSLAKIYIRENADMKIQNSDDTIITTYNAIEPVYVSMSATKVPDVGETAKINLLVSCKGMDWINYNVGNAEYIIFNKCSSRILSIYNGFKPYVEPKLK